MFDYLLSIILTILIITNAASKLYSKRVKRINPLILIFVALIINLIIILNINSLAKTVLIILIQIILLNYCFKIDLNQNIGFNITAVLIDCLAYKISINFYYDLINYLNFDFKIAILLIAFIFGIISFSSWFILITFIKDKQYISNKRNYFLLVVPLVTIFVILFLMNSDIPNVINLVLLMILTLSNYILLYIYLKNVVNANKKELDIERKYYKEKIEFQNEQYNNSFDFVHNMLYKMADIDNNLNNDNIEIAKEEVSKLHKKLAQEFNILYTNSRTLSLVLNKYLDELISNNIHVKTNIKYNDFTFINDEDLTLIIEKLIVYAIDKCRSSNEEYKFININSDLKNQNVIINLVFSSDSPVGDLSIEKVLEKYQALLYQDANKDHREFIDICFNLSIIKDNLALEHRNENF